jgi:hypothetical protein
MRTTRSYIAFSVWFAVVGPLVAFPIPLFIIGAHIVGFVPAVLTGLALAHRYRSSLTPGKAWRRSLSGFQVGCTISMICFLLGAIADFFIRHESRTWHFRLWLESAVLFGFGFAILGAIAGAFAFSTMPEQLRNDLLGKSTDANPVGSAGEA